ncbi:MAG: amidohydrolase family protein [Candidatus Krumholzibacteriota bacterium]
MKRTLLIIAVLSVTATAGRAQIAVRGGVVHTMAGESITNGVVVIEGGKIARVGPADEVTIPADIKVFEAAVVTPGLVDVHTTVGLSGIYNVPHDQDQLEKSAPLQPELRALDAYNPLEQLVGWVRSFGVTTMHTGHGPGAPVSGQTMIVKTRGTSVDEAVVQEATAVAVTITRSSDIFNRNKLLTTRAKTIALLRQDLIKAGEYRAKLDAARNDDDVGAPDRDLHVETMVRVLEGELALMVTAHRVRDIMGALRLADEFGVRLWLDGAAEAHQVLPTIKEAGVPVLLHPTMMRAFGETENASFETASLLRDAGVPFAIQSGYEIYVPKTRVILFEAGVAASHGLGFDDALAAITLGAARILGIDDRVGSLEVGKDGDLALYDGDPFEYATHCVGTIIEGEVVSDLRR